MNDLEHAHTGTHALGTTESIQDLLCGSVGGYWPAAPTELVVVDLVAPHDEEPHEELPGDGDFGFGTPAPMEEGEVGPPEVGIHPGRMRRGLTEGETEERAALLGNVTEVILVGGGIQGGSQADVADHVLAVGEAS